MSKREFWEIVRVVDVVPGDVVVADPSFYPATIDKKLDTGSIPIMGGIRMWCETVFRRIPDTDDPRVLRRAIEIMHSDFASSDSQSIEGYIREAKEDIENKARRELESEGNDE